MNPHFTVKQKIELLKIAATLNPPTGLASNTLDETIKNYDRLLEAVTIDNPNLATVN